MIELRDLTKRYGERVAVDDLTVTVPSGRVTALLGPNGAGKSTAMRLILGLDRPSAGAALIDGHRYGDLRDPLRAVGAHLDSRTFHPRRSGRAHLRALARYNGIPQARVDAVIETVGLGAVARRRAGTYSLGMAQRLGMAAVMLGDPATVVLDEPVNGLDADGVFWVRRLVRRWSGEGRTVLISSHLMSEVALVADRIVVLGRGRLLADTTLEAFTAGQRAAVEVAAADAASFDRLSAALAGATVERGGADRLRVADLDAATVGRLAHEAGAVLRELRTDRTTLEEAYLRLVGDEVEFSAGAAVAA
jgi:ABC-2 type transport system ATP-binding protein